MKFQFFTRTRIIYLSFLAVIFSGALLLCLPIATKDGLSVNFAEALFTAFSATTTTGLTVVNTGATYSLFGQIVILFMMQIGGLGFITFFGFFSVLIKGNVSLHERNLLKQAAGAVSNESFGRFIKRILWVTLALELAGILLTSITFVPKFGFFQGLFYAVFHVVSAFTNSGFDLGGEFGSGSIALFSADPIMVITIGMLGFLGGLGFIIWNDFIDNGVHFKRYSLHSKIVLVASGLTFTIAYILTLILDWNVALAGLPVSQKFLDGFFMTISPLTSGYYVISPNTYSEGSVFLQKILMLIGGSSGSTAGGLKTTTIVILLGTLLCELTHKKNLVLFKRTIPESAIRQSMTILTAFLVAIIASTIALAYMNPLFTVKELTMDIVAAITTDGLAFGISQDLTLISQIILMILMLYGRIGGMSLYMLFTEGTPPQPVRGIRPSEDILVG